MLSFRVCSYSVIMHSKNDHLMTFYNVQHNEIRLKIIVCSLLKGKCDNIFEK